MRGRPTPAEARAGERRRLGEVFLVFLRLGLTSFGGPIAHLGYFRDEYVARRKWIDERATPISSRSASSCRARPAARSGSASDRPGGLPGALAAWLGFTLPSALALILFALGVATSGVTRPGLLHGLKVVGGRGRRAGGVGHGAHARARRAARDDRDRSPRSPRSPGRPRSAQVVVIAAGGLVGLALPARRRPTRAARARSASPRLGRRCRAGVFFVLLVGAAAARGSRPAARRSPSSTASTAPGRSCSAAGTSCCRCSRPRSCRPAGSHDAVPRRVRGGPGRAGPAVHLLRLPRRGDAAAAQRRGRRGDLPGRDLPARRSCSWSARCPFWDALRRARVPGGAARDQRGGGRAAARRALPAGVDERDPAPAPTSPRLAASGC